MAKKSIPSIIKQIQKYKLPEVNYAFQKAISYSQLSTYLACGKKWELNYKDGNFTSSPSINMTFGTSLHETLQHYITVMYEESGTKADEIDLTEHFEGSFQKAYQADYDKNKKVHFSNPVEMREFYDDGIAILDFIKKKRGEYFSKRGWYLVGCEVPILITPDKRYNRVLYKGYLDLVLYHEPTNKFVIYDIKTATKSWGDKEKKDEIKQMQLVLYKQFFSEQFGIPVDDIEVEFMILKRKIWENSEFPQKRIQKFIPASGKNKIIKSKKAVIDFIEDVFNGDGSYKDKIYSSSPSKWNCRFCAYAGSLCKDAIL